jgi:hypothetical protein
MMKWFRIAIFLLLLAAALAITAIFLDIQVYCDRYLICSNTGSRESYREWMFGIKTRHHYTKSPLEEYMETHYPNALVHRWKIYASTIKNTFSKVFEDGDPGAVFKMDHRILRIWIQHNDSKSIRELHDLFVSDDQEKIKKRVMEITDEVFKYDN